MTTLYVSSALGVSRDTFEAMEAGAARFGVNELRKLCDLLRIRPKAFYVEGDLRPAG